MMILRRKVVNQFTTTLTTWKKWAQKVAQSLETRMHISFIGW